MSEALAAIVRKSRSAAVLETLRARGIYDPTRKIREHDSETVAIPVTAPPSIDVLDIARQSDPTYRELDLATLLRERGWSDAELERAPQSWAVLGSVILVRVPDDCPDETAVGEALLEVHGQADTVLARRAIAGPEREPNPRVIAGIGDTQTVHTEHGIQYGLDLSEVMFSPGNKAERARMAGAVAASDSEPAFPPDTVPDDSPDLRTGQPHERVFDMFAGIGYFTLPLAVAGAQVTAAEIRPTTFQYLIENIQLNDVSDRVAAYLADCRDVQIKPPVDRVIMGHYDAPAYLPTAIEAIRPGGIIHLHTATPTPEFPDDTIAALETATAEAGRTIGEIHHRQIKTHAAGVVHGVIDARVHS